VTPVQARERGLDRLLGEAQEDEGDEEAAHPLWLAIGEAYGRTPCATMSISAWPAW
jgi:hypothetical protein